MEEATPGQRYRSTRGGSQGLGFEEVVLKGLADDGGLFVPEKIPRLPEDWDTRWRSLDFPDLAFEIMSLYIAPSEIPSADLKDILRRTYSKWDDPKVTPLKTLDDEQRLHILELFHGETKAFKDVALAALGNVFEYLLSRRNKKKDGAEPRHHLTVLGATSGDTGSAAIYGLRGKKDVSVFITFPHGRVSQVQEAQMTTVRDPNVHCVAIQGTEDDPATFDDCQDLVKALFSDKDINQTHHLAAINSINWCRILAQITYYFHAYFAVTSLESWSSSSKIRFVCPTGNFGGDILAGFYAKRMMNLPNFAKLVVATNENDILHRFFQTGRYEKTSVSNSRAADASLGLAADGAKAHSAGAIETLSPAMDIVVSSNFERLLYILQLEARSPVPDGHEEAAKQVSSWLSDLKSKGGFTVPPEIHSAAASDFESEKVTDPQTLATIRTFFAPPIPTMPSYILDPHSAIGVAASLRSISREGPPDMHTVSLATAHPAKFANAVTLALENESGFDFETQVLPEEFRGIESKPRRVQVLEKSAGISGLRQLIRDGVEAERSSHPTSI